MPPEFFTSITKIAGPDQVEVKLHMGGGNLNVGRDEAVINDDQVPQVLKLSVEGEGVNNLLIRIIAEGVLEQVPSGCRDDSQEGEEAIFCSLGSAAEPITITTSESAFNVAGANPFPGFVEIGSEWYRIPKFFAVVSLTEEE